MGGMWGTRESKRTECASRQTFMHTVDRGSSFYPVYCSDRRPREARNVKNAPSDDLQNFGIWIKFVCLGLVDTF
jgi:hypothetical protein